MSLEKSSERSSGPIIKRFLKHLQYKHNNDDGGDDGGDDGDDGDDGDEDHLFAAPSIRCGLHHLEDRVGGETEPETHTELQSVRLFLNACLDAKY